MSTASNKKSGKKEELSEEKQDQNLETPLQSTEPRSLKLDVTTVVSQVTCHSIVVRAV